ncbi:hypothetical protein AVEN_47670-1 [Araneus ventricosus]|uniref:Uncharacterized protein n=1 Tax=Araneus ventricosus TaxID=182803 RepID=A0A4Y2ISI5_ARAVE|nr:hypothetical protein AVEN_47670-1 [Araneus ventricosus]
MFALGHPAHIPTVIQFRPDVQWHVSFTVRHSSSDAFLQRSWHWGHINFVLHITSQEEITWRGSGDLGSHGNRGSSRPAHPIQRCGSSLLRKSRTIVLQCRNAR